MGPSGTPENGTVGGTNMMVDVQNYWLVAHIYVPSSHLYLCATRMFWTLCGMGPPHADRAVLGYELRRFCAHMIRV